MRPPRPLIALALASLLTAPVRAADDDVVLSLYQGPCAEGDFRANLDIVRRQVAEARARGSHFVLFPECFLSGYESPEAVGRGARPLDDPELAAFLHDNADHDTVIVVGLARRAADGLHNTMLVLQRGQILGLYDKVMLTGGDVALGFRPGTSVPVFSAHGVRFGVIICHDSSFPDVAQAARLQGAQLLLSPHNNEIGAVAADEHRRTVRNTHVGLAAQLKMVVARANIVKSDRAGQIGYGDSFVLDPQGEPLAEAGLFRTTLLTTRIPRAMLRTGSRWANAAEVPAWLRTLNARLLDDFRKPSSDDDLRRWLENMVVHHRFTTDEVHAATGLTADEIRAAIQRFDLAGKTPPPRQPGDPLRVLPYPGGRHPRIGFLDGAIMPQRETKVSVFTPWDDAGYVVADIPEAIFSNLGLLYLAHTHVPTLWDAQGLTLPRQEWRRLPDGSLESERTLPNGVAFGARVTPTPTEVRMELWLRNGTDQPLSGLRVQNCVMLAGAPGFDQQTNDNKLFRPPYAAARSPDGTRWIITAWSPIQRAWGNPPCPCLHADPQFPDCPSGQTVRLRGWLSFHEGTDLDAELARIEATGWRD
jgi:predicted amidohydrolase